MCHLNLLGVCTELYINLGAFDPLCGSCVIQFLGLCAQHYASVLQHLLPMAWCMCMNNKNNNNNNKKKKKKKKATVGRVLAGLRINSGALDPAVGAGGYGGVVVRSPAGARVCMQAATPHQAPGRPHTHAQGEGQEEGGAIHLDL